MLIRYTPGPIHVKKPEKSKAKLAEESRREQRERLEAEIAREEEKRSAATRLMTEHRVLGELKEAEEALRRAEVAHTEEQAAASALQAEANEKRSEVTAIRETIAAAEKRARELNRQAVELDRRADDMSAEADRKLSLERVSGVGLTRDRLSHEVARMIHRQRSYVAQATRRIDNLRIRLGRLKMEVENAGGPHPECDPESGPVASEADG